MQEVLTVLTPPSVEPVTLADAKAFARVEITDDDALITGLIPSARQICESRTKLALVSRQYLWQLDYFPNRIVFSQGGVWVNWMNSRIYPWVQGQVLFMPKPPLISVDRIQYYDTNGTLQTLSSSLYVASTGIPGRLAPSPGTDWPATQDRIGAVQITFTAGFSADASAVPPNLITGMKLLVSLWYRKREAATDTPMSSLPMAVDALFNSSKWGFYG